MSTDNFKWTTQLVNEFACKLVMSKEGVGYTIQDFIDSKQPPLSKDKERIEVGKMACVEIQPYGNSKLKWQLQFKTNKYIHYDKAVGLCNVLEAALNEDTVVYNQLGEKVTDYKEENVDRGMPITKTMNSVEAYNEGYIQGVKFCEKYGIPKHQIGAGKSTKPPLGLLPKHIWEEQRIWDIAAAIERYKEAGKEIPQEWINENYDLRKIPKPKTDTVVEDKAHSVLINEDIYFHNNGRSYNEWFYEFRIKKEIEQGKWNALAKLIVDFINAPLGEIVTIEQYRAKKYTQSEVDAIREETFLASRRLNGAKKCSCYDMKFPYYSDYLNSLNPDNKAYTGKDSKVDWEIIQFNQKDGSTLWVGKNIYKCWYIYDKLLRRNFDRDEKWMIENGYPIHSVKRLSDNTVFSVKERDSDGFLITGFNIIGNQIEVELDYGSRKISLTHLQPQPIPEKTVTDNSDVACLSLNDVKELWDNHYGGSLLIRDFANSLQQLVTQKLKTHTP